LPVFDTIYQARLLLPDLIERGRTNALSCPVYKDGALSAPSSGTVSVYNAANEVVINAASVTVAASIATYSLTSATLSGRALEDGWRVEWALLMGDSTVHTFRNDAALVRYQLAPVVTDLDLYRLHPDLNPSDGASIVASGTNYQTWLEESWTTLQLRLINAGNRPNLVMSPSALREYHLYATLELIARHFSTSTGQGKWQALAESYATRAEKAWDVLKFTYDADDDGVADNARRRSARPVTFLGGAENWRWGS
jgi:hypothetical protein